MRETDNDIWINERLPDISLRDILTPLFRRKRALIITFVSVLAIVISAVTLIPAQFTSRMSILVNRERQDPLVTTGTTTQTITVGNPVSEEEINSEAELLKSRDVLEKVVIDNGLQNLHGGTLLGFLRPKQTEADRIERAVQALADKIKVEAGTKTDLINVTYSSSDPLLSYRVLKTLGNLYMEKHVAVHRPPGSYEFFAQETQRYQQALKDSESQLKDFEDQPGAAAPEAERTDLAVQVTNSIGQMHSTEQLIAADEQRIHSDEQHMAVTPQRTATKQDTDVPTLLLQTLGSSLLAAETKRTQLLLKYDPTYPLVKEADQEVAEAKAAIARAEKNPYVNQETDRDPTFELLREDLAKSQIDLAAQHASLAAIKGTIASLQSQMADLDRKSLTQQDLQRDVKANEDNYLLYLSKREQERTADALDKTRIANVAIAVPPDIPALPSHSIPFVMFVGLFLSTILAIAMAYILDYFDPSFHSPAQVIEILNIPVVVAVPNCAA